MSAKKVSILCSITYYCSDCQNVTNENTSKCNIFLSSIKPQLSLNKNPESSQCCIIIFILIKNWLHIFINSILRQIKGKALLKVQETMPQDYSLQSYAHNLKLYILKKFLTTYCKMKHIQKTK